MRTLRTPLTKTDIEQLKAGDEVVLTGVMYTGRDQAHKQLVDLISANRKLPVDLNGQLIYYCGPTETAKRNVIGSCGPTTSARMDGFVEPLLKKGMVGMIGKGRRNKEVRELIKKYSAVYFIAPAGCGALLAQKVVNKTVICFPELGAEAVCRLQVKDFPLIVAIDSKGKGIYGDL